VSISNDLGIKDSRGGLKRVDGGINTKGGEVTRQHSVSIQMCECGGRSGIGQIICWHVHSLHRGNGTILGGGNSLLKTTEIGSEGRLITDSGWNTTEKGGHLGTCLGESEDIVDEKKHILAFLISEVLGNGETGQSDTSSGTWGLVHLSVHKGHTRTSSVRTINLDNTGLNHFVIKIIALTGSLTDTSEHGVTTMCLSDVVNKLHDKYGFAYTCTTEKTILPPF
jgi:peptide chain release factor 1